MKTKIEKKKRALKALAKRLSTGRSDYLAHRAVLASTLKAHAENGMVAVIESGRDCDGVAYDGRVSLIPAMVVAYERHDQQIAEYADGPYHLSICTPSAAKSIEYTSRDLTMEAFENGHQHVIYP